MIWGVLSVKTEGIVNIGDYVQAVAARQFIENKEVKFIERERLDEYKGEDCSMIMNGWYIHNPKHWPPSSSIKPLFVAFHLNSLASNQLLSSAASVKYLKNHEPIGCRDEYTCAILKEKGIDAYFSGCLTLTLGYKYLNKDKRDKVYIVDPLVIFKVQDLFLQNILLYLLTHFKDINSVSKQLFSREGSSIKRILKTASFLKTYSDIFDYKTLVNAEYVDHMVSKEESQRMTAEELWKKAEALVEKYASAKLVITSRIHCALPCLGLETPVAFIKNESDPKESTCRFGGLSELFNECLYTKKRKLKLTFDHKGLISTKNLFENKPAFISIKDKLIDTCKTFFSIQNKK